MRCHLCGTILKKYIDLHQQPLANSLLSSPDEQDKVWYSAVWAWCPSCELLQLIDVPPAEVVYTASYPYKSSQSQFMNDHFRKTAQYLYDLYHLGNGKVIEIAVNTGGIIQFLSCTVLGFEPAQACRPDLNSKGIPFHGDVFNNLSARATSSVWGQADLVYCANTLRSLKDLREIFESVLLVLKEDGVFVIEDPYLVNILDRNEWDQFYSENVYGFTVTSMQHIARRYGMELIAVDPLPDNHGGSLRYHMARKGARPVGHIEMMKGMNDEAAIPDKLATFQQVIDDISTKFTVALSQLKRDGKRVVGYGATAKAVTLLNYANIGPDLIECIYDTTAEKWNKFIPGIKIPILSADKFDEDDAHTVILFAYNHRREILSRENKKRQRRWLVYHPGVMYVTD